MNFIICVLLSFTVRIHGDLGRDQYYYELLCEVQLQVYFNFLFGLLGWLDCEVLRFLGMNLDL